MKRQLTPEQIAKRDARKEKFRTLWKQVASMPELERVQMSNKLGLVTCDGHALSLCNTMLVALQCPGASVLGGFRQWLKHGRCVRKGEHGAMIWVPIGHGKAAEGTAQPDGTDPVTAGDTRFIIGTMFDISQTQEVEAGATVPNETEAVFDPKKPFPHKLPPIQPMPESRETVLASMTQNFFQNMGNQLSTGSATP